MGVVVCLFVSFLIHYWEFVNCLFFFVYFITIDPVNRYKYISSELNKIEEVKYLRVSYLVELAHREIFHCHFIIIIFDLSPKKHHHDVGIASMT